MAEKEKDLGSELLGVLHESRQGRDPSGPRETRESSNSPRSTAMTKRATAPAVLAEAAADGPSALEEDFGGKPREQLEQHRGALSSWQRFLFDREIGKLERHEALKIAKKIFEYELEAMFQKLTLSLDIEKKRTFIEYMRRTEGLRRDLQRLDTAACLSLQQSLMDINVQIYTINNRNESLIEQLTQQGIISGVQAEQERAKNRELCERNLEGAFATLDNMWNSHKQLLEYTLKITINELFARAS
jgi:hypothetical protein